MFTFPFTNFTAAGFENLLSTNFNGVDEYVQTSKDFSGATEFTISGWFYRTSDAHRLDISQSDNANSNRVKLILNSDTTAIVVIGSSSRKSVALGTGWYHLVFVYDGTLTAADRIKLYVDGVLEGVTTGTPPSSVPVIGSSQTLRIGQDNGASRFAQGNLDEVTIWDVPLTSGEVDELYNSGTTFNPETHSQSANLVNYWRMGDGDDATTIFDHIGTDDGTLVNMDASNYTTDVPS